MTTYSTSLKLTLIGDGDQAGTWGQTTNTNLGTLLEQAITGVVNITMTDANYTLTDFNGVSDEARNAVLVVGGTNTAIRNIVAPSVKKLYVITNATVGGYAIRIKTSAGTGILIPNGVTTAVYCDSSEFYEQQTGTIGNFSVGGNLSVTGTTTLTTALPVTSGGTGASTANTALNNLLPTQTTANGKYLKSDGTNSSWDAIDISTSDVSGVLAVANGGTGASTASGARTNLGLGTMSTQDSTSVNISGGTITGSYGLTASNVSGTVAVANGGTGATSAATALSNLGAYPASNPNGYTSNTGTVTSVATSGSVNGLTLTGGTITSTGTITLGGAINASTISTGVLAVANGGTGSATAAFSGANITSLNASQLSSGTVPTARFPSGMPIKVLNAYKTNSQTITGASWVDISGLSITLTPASASSTFLIMPKVFINGNANHVFIRILRNGSVVGNAISGSTLNGNSFTYGTNIGAIIGADYLDSPTTAASITYKLQTSDPDGGTMYININSAGTYGATSSLSIIEIAG